MRGSDLERLSLLARMKASRSTAPEPRRPLARALPLSHLVAAAEPGLTRFLDAEPHPFLLTLPAREGGKLTQRSRVYRVIGRAVRIGRGGDCHVTLRGARVSRLHVTITLDPTTGAHVVADAGSRNGTELNGVRLAPHEPQGLVAGDVLQLGGATLKFMPPRAMYDLILWARPVPRKG
jgi:hypothetical protein